MKSHGKGQSPYDLTKLPHENPHGHFYFGLPTDNEAPVIFLARQPKLNGLYFIYAGLQGVLFDGPSLRTFETPEAALVELRRQFRNKRGT